MDTGFGVEVVDCDEVFIVEYDDGGIVFLRMGDVDSKARTAVEDWVGGVWLFSSLGGG